MTALETIAEKYWDRSFDDHSYTTWEDMLAAVKEAHALGAKVISAARDLSDSLNGGFVRCARCGDQEDTTDLDFAADLRAALKEYEAQCEPQSERSQSGADRSKNGN